MGIGSGVHEGIYATCECMVNTGIGLGMWVSGRYPRHKSCSIRGRVGAWLLIIMLAVRRSLASLRTCRFNHSYPTTLNSVTEHDLAHFAKVLPASSILSTCPPSTTPPEELDQFNSDWMGRYKGHSTTVLKPKTTQQVSEIVKWCNEKRIGVVPQGGNTGLVGGSVPVRDEVILSLANMNTVRSFDPVSGNYHSRLSSLLQSKFTSVSSPMHRYISGRRWLYPSIAD
jgi:hypothetical protein